MNSVKSDLNREIKENSVLRLEENLLKIQKCIASLSEEEVWHRPNKASNSIGNLMVHLCGNVTQYILAGLDGREDVRKRDEEFSVEGGFVKEELFTRLSDLIEEVKEVIMALTEEQLTRQYKVQGFDLSGFGILLHVVEHFSYHTGQIAFWVKYLKDKDLQFYRGLDLNKKNNT